MVDTRQHDDGRITLTGASLSPIPIEHATTASDSSAHDTQNTQNTQVPENPPLKRTATAGSAPIEAVEPLVSKRDVRAAVPLTRLETDVPTSRPPMLQKFMTEQPVPNAKRAPLGQQRATAYRPEDLHQVSFDPYSSSDSSSDSDSDDEPPASRLRSAKKGLKRKGGADSLSKFRWGNDDFKTKGRVSRRDGRLRISIQEAVNNGYFAKTLGIGLKKYFKAEDEKDEDGETPDARNIPESKKIAPEDEDMEHPEKRMTLNICIIVIGSRGDIQPFIRIGRILQDDYGHRVRIATHPTFRKFVEEDSGLEFFSVGGDPAELMAFMVKNPGLLPSVETITQGEVGRRRAAMFEMFQGMWRACINSTDDETDKANMKLMGSKEPFVADAIIANPPSFAPPHIAERLGVPLHMMFTFPYSPTVQFPHPLANIKSSNVDANYANFMSYPLVEMMTWQGLGDLVNKFRVKTLGLEEVSTLWAPGQLYRLKVPYTYMWSPGLVPKPKDWGPEIDIAGFVFLELASTFKPPETLTKFLDAGPPPVYIGFGSIVVDDPKKFTELIFEAVKMAGVRALVSEGWGGIGDRDNTPENIYILDNTPHDWLFPRVSAVVHHGGAGTTAMGLKCAKPTMIVPFFGDQPFWGAMVSTARAGAHECIPYKKLTAERLAEGIKQCLSEEAKKNVKKIADSIASEGDGARNAVRSFHRNLALRGEKSMRCHILDERVAAWRLKNTSLHLSPLAAELLVDWKKIKWNELRLLRHWEWNDFGGPGEPITGGWGAIISALAGAATGVGSIPVHMAKSIKKREEHLKKKQRIKKRQQHAKEKLAAINAAQNAAAKKGDGALSKSNSQLAAQNSRPGMQREGTNLSKLSKLSADPSEDLAEELAKETGRGFKQTGEAILKAPMDLTLALTLGFHNAPRLYGDPTVRPPHRITGVYSGLRAGRDEFLHGVFDGFTGLVTQPYTQARQDGVLGFFRGVAMGAGGLVLKNVSAVLGPFAFGMKGVHEEVRKRMGHQPTGYIRRARIVQGRRELERLGGRRPGQERSGRADVEMRVSRSWEGMRKRIRAERGGYTAQLKRHIVGKKKRERKAAERQRRVAQGAGQRKTKTQPVTANGNANGTAKGTANGTGPVPPPLTLTAKPDAVENGGDGDIEPAAVKKTATAPGKTLDWKARVKRRWGIEKVPSGLKEEARREGGVVA